MMKNESVKKGQISSENFTDHFVIVIKFKDGNEEQYEISKEDFNNFEITLINILQNYTNNHFAILKHQNGIILFSLNDVFTIKSLQFSRLKF